MHHQLQLWCVFNYIQEALSSLQPQKHKKGYSIFIQFYRMASCFRTPWAMKERISFWLVKGHENLGI